MKIPKESTEWVSMVGRFRNIECSICHYSLRVSGTACEEDSCLGNIPISQNTLIVNLIKILEIE